MTSIAEAFPIPYAHWYAAALFLDAGHPRDKVLPQIGLTCAAWDACNHRYGLLHFANMSWVASSYRREGLPDPAHDRSLYDHLLEDSPIVPSITPPFAMRRQLLALRRRIEADPHIGPFTQVDWIACYICEKAFPTLRYVHDGTQVFAKGQPLAGRSGKVIDGIDPATFTQLGQRWFRDATRVYGQGEVSHKAYWFVMRGADPDSFEVLNERYARDNAAGYYITNRRLPCEDASTFQVISYYYGRGQKPGLHTRESHYAKDSLRVYGYGVAIPKAHAPSFISTGDEGKYFVDRNHVYWERTLMQDADRATFICASEAGQYRAFDANRPYWAGKSMSVGAEFDRWTEFFTAHPELHDTWWHNEKARREAAPDTSTEPTPLGGPYFTDGRRIMVPSRNRRDGPWTTLDHFDAPSFRHIVDVFGADKDGLRYVLPGLEGYGRPPVKGGDAATFTARGDGWYRDAGQIYFFDAGDYNPDLAIVKADPATFKVLGGIFARDADAVFIEGVRKRDFTDPSAVVPLGGFYARIGDTIYCRAKPVKKPGAIDITTARGFPGVAMLLDAGGHMLLGTRYRKPVPGLDPASFRFITRDFAVDDTRVYGLTHTKFAVCGDVDRATVQPDAGRSIRDQAARFFIGTDDVETAPLPD